MPRPSTASEFDFAGFRDFVAERVALCPRFSWRIKHVPFGMDLPYWVDDETLDFTKHVHRIALPAPVRDGDVLRALRDTGGTAVAVSEDDIAAGLVALGRAGFCVEPTSAVVWGGLRRLRDSGAITAEARTVLILSGHGLKATTRMAELIGA